MKINHLSYGVIVLVLLVTFESLGAIYGGISLISDPTGEKLDLPKELLEGAIFSSFLIPGIILFILLGIFPLFLIFPLLFRPRWRIFERLNIYPTYHWSWTFTLYTSILLIIWVDVQIIILEYGSVIQAAFSLMGVVMLIISLMPSVKKYYLVRDRNRHQNSIKK